MGVTLCSVCGNKVAPGPLQCPYCQDACGLNLPRPAEVLHRQVNLKHGMPLVQHALDRLESAIRQNADERCKVLTLIHGYGSSGTGGAIKTAVQHQLQFLRHQGRIEAIIPGEHFEGRSGRGRQLLRRFPFLAAHRDLNRANPGVTLVVL
jgi:Smr domain.